MGKSMGRFFKFVFPGLIVLILMLTAVSSGSAETDNTLDKHKAPKGSLIITNNKISADFEDVSLGEILIGIKDRNNIWFKGDESLLNEKISVRFTDLSLEHGMKRILRSANYALVYHDNGNLAGLILFNKSSQEKTIANIPPHFMQSSSEKVLQEDNEEAPSSSEQSDEIPQGYDAVPEIRMLTKSVIAPKHSLGSHLNY